MPAIVIGGGGGGGGGTPGVPPTGGGGGTGGGSTPYSSTAVSVSNLVLTGLQTVDGYTLLEADRVLLVGQTDRKQNGLWVAHAAAWTRPTDFAAASRAAGAQVNVTRGSTYGSSVWGCSTAYPNDVVDANNLTFLKMVLDFPALVVAPAIPVALVNGNFETGNLTGWTLSQTGTAPLPSATNSVDGGPHTGTWKMSVGTFISANAGDSTATQNVVLPSVNVGIGDGIQLSFWMYLVTQDTIAFDQQKIQIRDATGTIVLATILNACSNASVWTNTLVDLTPWAGQTVQLWFSVHTDTSLVTRMHIDDVTINAIHATLTPTPITLASKLVGSGGIEAPSYPATQNGMVSKGYLETRTFLLPVRVATTGFLGGSFPPTTLLTIDGTTTVEGDRVLIKDEGVSADRHGIWIAHAGGWTRAADMAAGMSFEFPLIKVMSGNTQGNSIWGLQTNSVNGGTVGGSFWSPIPIGGQNFYFSTPTQVAGGTGSSGTSSRVARGDHSHQGVVVNVSQTWTGTQTFGKLALTVGTVSYSTVGATITVVGSYAKISTTVAANSVATINTVVAGWLILFHNTGTVPVVFVPGGNIAVGCTIEPGCLGVMLWDGAAWRPFRGQDQSLGPLITVAGTGQTIAPTSPTHHMTMGGADTISTITPRYTGFVGHQHFIADVLLTFVPGGNIASAFTIPAGTMKAVYFDGTSWYPM